MPSTRSKRPHIPIKAKLHAALYALGLDPSLVEFDHDPSLGMRPYDEITGEYSPPANDPRYIVPRQKSDHAIKTDGTHVPLSGDKSKIAKVRRISRKQEEFRQRLLEKLPKEERPPSKWPKRGFQRRPKNEER